MHPLSVPPELVGHPDPAVAVLLRVGERHPRPAGDLGIGQRFNELGHVIVDEGAEHNHAVAERGVRRA
jgi:hypothetical protein